MNPTHRLATTATVLAVLGLAVRLAGAPPSPPSEDRQESLDALRKMAAGYRVRLGAERIAKLDEEPAIRWNKPVSEVEDAALFWWTYEGRPIAAATFLWQRRIGLYHEFQSLTPEPVRAERHGATVWQTSKPGIAFAPVPGAPLPAETQYKRLIQMKALAEEFRVEAIKGPPFYAVNSVYKFRLLRKPVLRYRDQQRPELEGAVFAFVQDTDPEGLLILESRTHADAMRWEFALAPMTGWRMKGWHKNLEVWSIEHRHPAHDPTQPYFVAGPFPLEGEYPGR